MEGGLQSSEMTLGAFVVAVFMRFVIFYEGPARCIHFGMLAPGKVSKRND